MTSPEPELTRRMALDESLLLGYPNSALDLLFRQSEAGPIPDGDTQGTLLAWPGTWLAKPLALLVRVIIWQGKVLDRREGDAAQQGDPVRSSARQSPALGRIELGGRR